MSSNGFRKVKRSGHFRSSAHPKGSGPDFVNGVILSEAPTHDPIKVLQVLHDIEATLGRVRHKRWAARVIDLDLIDFGGQVLPDAETVAAWRDLPIAEQMQNAPAELLLPHPRLQDRAFVLVPLQVVCPDFTHPVTGESIDQMLAKISPEDIADVTPI